MRTLFISHRPCCRLLAAAALALAMARPAPAHNFCVTNSADLQSGLTAASTGGLYNGENNYFSLVQGTYLTGAGGFHYASAAAHDLFVNGGYTDALCTDSLRSNKPLLTKLDGHATTGVLSISNPKGYISVNTLTLQNGVSGGPGTGPGAGLRINYLATPNIAVAILDVVIRDNNSVTDAGGLYVSASYLYLYDSLIVDNSARNLYGGGYVTGNSDDDYAFVVNNTVTRNTSGVASNPVGGLYVGGTVQWFADRNIFWANTGPGLYIGNDTVQLSENDYGNLGGMTPLVNYRPTSHNPNFINPDNGNFRLAVDSPLIGYATLLEDGGYADLDGNVPPKGGQMDLGAYYETIFVDGFTPAH